MSHAFKSLVQNYSNSNRSQNVLIVQYYCSNIHSAGVCADIRGNGGTNNLELQGVNEPSL